MADTWKEIYWKWVNKGADHFLATWRADEWERKLVAKCPSAHCERRRECASPNDCIVKDQPKEATYDH